MIHPLSSIRRPIHPDLRHHCTQIRRITGQSPASAKPIRPPGQNLPDGRVELLASGEKDEVRAFITAIGESELRAHIRRQTEEVADEPTPARGFEIRHE